MAKLQSSVHVIVHLLVVVVSVVVATSLTRKESLPTVNFTCTGIGMYTCQNNRCISSRWFCDGEDDCRTGEDEDPARCNSKTDDIVKTKVRKHRELTNRKLVVTTILEEPYMMMKERGAFLAGNDRFEGYLADILQRLATSVGFKYETRLSRDGKYGELGPDGTWNGMIGEVQSGEADIAAGALIVTDTLRQYVNFTEPFLSMRWSTLIRRPPNDGHGGTVLQPSRGSASNTAGNRRQSQSAVVSGSSRRMSTAAQLLRSDVTCGVVENSVAHQMLAMTSDPVGQALYQRMMTQSASSSSSSLPSSHRGGGSASSDPFVRSVQEGIDRARRERYAFVLDSPTAEYVASREPCDLYTVEPFLDVATYAFAVRRRRHHHSSHNGDDTDDENRLLRQAIDREMRRMKQSGEMQSMYLRWWRDECSKSVNDEPGLNRRHQQQQQPVSVTSSSDLSRRHARVSVVSSSSSARADFTSRTLATTTLLTVLVVMSVRYLLAAVKCPIDWNLGKR